MLLSKVNKVDKLNEENINYKQVNDDLSRKISAFEEENESFKSEIENLKSDNYNIKAENSKLKKLVTKLQSENDGLKEELVNKSVDNSNNETHSLYEQKWRESETIKRKLEDKVKIINAYFFYYMTNFIVIQIFIIDSQSSNND